MSGVSKKSCAYCRGDGKIGCMSCPACESKEFIMVSQPVTPCACRYGTGISGCFRCTTCKGSGYANVITATMNEQ